MNVQEFVTQLLAHMGLSDVQVVVDETPEALTVTLAVSEEDSGMMIGRHGETIEGIQKVVLLSLREEIGEKRIVVNVNDYLERRLQKVEDLAKQTAERVRTSQHPIALPHLRPNERRIVHMALKDEEGIETRSDGEGKDRTLTVYPKQAVV